ncbi:MAG: response regulator [Thermoanaerobaculia bacterium]
MEAVAVAVTPPEVKPDPSCALRRPKRIVIVDDSLLFAESWRAVVAARYGEKVQLETYQDPLKAIPHFGPEIDLLLIDLEMPVLDGRKLAAFAKERGVPCRRIVILSGHHADELHRLFPQDSCLAVINKTEPQQQSAFLMILDSVVKRP